jgi:transposase-like protein
LLQKEITGIDEQILALYAKGVSVWEIQAHLNQLCGIDVSPTLISNVTNRIMPLIKEWQSRPLQKTYAESYNPGGGTGERLLCFSSIRWRFAN